MIIFSSSSRVKTPLFQISFEFRIHRKMERTCVRSRNDARANITSVKSISSPSSVFPVTIRVTISSMIDNIALARRRKFVSVEESADIATERMPERTHSLGESDSVSRFRSVIGSIQDGSYANRLIISFPLVSSTSSVSLSSQKKSFRL